ncbi:MAG: flagellar biosynthesis protein FlhB [Alsobacter sp.]
MAEGGEDQEDRTEDPTQRKLEQAIERGDIAKSQEVNTWFVLAGGTLALMATSDFASQTLFASLRGMLANAGRVPADGAALAAYGKFALTTWMVTLAVPLGLVLLAGLLGSILQHQPVITTEPLAPQLSRISPMAGFKRVFGKEALVQFVKGLFKLAMVGAAIYAAIWPDWGRLEGLVRMDVAALLPATRTEAVKLLGAVLAIYAVLAAADYGYQKFTWFQRQRMTKQEIKQEHKEQEGSPEIKHKLRELRMAASRRRMMSKVPKATVVVMNPTHFAVALQYEAGMAAPICVAKGLDAMALKIRSVAEAAGVPVVENPPLARALYKAVELDQDIPVEHYKAVAEVIGYVMRLRRRLA